MLNSPQKGNFHHPLLHALKLLPSSTTIPGWTLPPGRQPKSRTQVSWGESLGSKVDQTLLTPCCLVMVYILSCFALSSTAHLSSGTPIHELISGLLCNNWTADMMLHFVPILLKYDSHFHLGSVCLQPQEKYLIPSSADPPATDFNLRVSKSCAKAWAFLFFHSILLQFLIDHPSTHCGTRRPTKGGWWLRQKT